MKKFIFCLLFFAGFACSEIHQTQNKQTSFDTQQISMALEADTLTPMRVLQVTNKEDGLLLRSKSEYILPNPKDKVLQHFIKRLYSTVTDSISPGVGIAAPQVGILKNIIWVQRFDKKNTPFEVYLNPRILQYTEQKQDSREGCLSIPNRMDTTQNRAYAILLEYDTPEGNHHTEMVEAFTAVIFQHEIDHLNGILYTDYLDSSPAKEE